jgi:hypothetical protein
MRGDDQAYSTTGQDDFASDPTLNRAEWSGLRMPPSPTWAVWLMQQYQTRSAALYPAISGQHRCHS